MMRIKNRFTNEIIYEDDSSTIKMCLENAVIKKINLKEANLKGADLSGAEIERINLSEANLQGVNLTKANLQGSNLERTDFSGANLKYSDFKNSYIAGAGFLEANLKYSDFRDAYLVGSYFEKANLECANLKNAKLRRTNIEKANIEGADLRGAKNIPQSLIRYFKKDLRYVLLHSKKELRYLKDALENGRIDGTQYEGTCCCLIGTLAKIKSKSFDNLSLIPYYDIGSHNPSEQLFYQIRKGDTPENNQFAKIALEVIEEIEKELMKK